MEEDHGIYDYKRRLELLEMKMGKRVSSPKNQKFLLGYKNDCIAQGTSLARVIRTLEDLLKLDSLIKKDFELVTTEDIKSAIVEMENQNYSDWTKYGFKISVRKFYKWLRKTETYPEEVKWIKPRLKRCESKLPQELLTEEEIKKMIESADNPRDRAFMSVLYESGCRIGEILTLKQKN